jgi:integrase
MTVTLLYGIVTVLLTVRGKLMENQSTGLDAPTAAIVTVSMKRPREYLTEKEIERLMDAARQNRHGRRDATAVLLAHRHGLRASELVATRWDDIDFNTGRLHVRRTKGGETTVHPIGCKELRALRRLQRETSQKSTPWHPTYQRSATPV